MEKKNTVLEQTIEGVDRTFAGLRELEQRLNDCSEQTADLPASVSMLRSDMDSLAQASEQIDTVLNKLNDLDDVLAQTSERIEEVEKARDWISRTEVRLNEMTKEAQEQVNLFGALMNEGRGKKQKSSAGAPPIAVRENVIKLAHQGWTTEKISAVMNLTIGEVELILDFYGKESR